MKRLPRIADYDTRLTERAKELRREQTPAEKRMWEILLRRDQMRGHRFLRQKPLRHFIVDFYCAELLLAIEIDGSAHDDRREYDEDRTVLLNELNIEVIRYHNDEVMNDIVSVANDLERRVRDREKELATDIPSKP